jgi:ATP-binding cassette subfamily C protein
MVPTTSNAMASRVRARLRFRRTNRTGAETITGATARRVAAPGLLADAAALVAVAWRLRPRLVVSQLALLLATGTAGGTGLLLLLPVVRAVSAPAPGPDGPPLWLLLTGVVGLVAGQAWATRLAAVNAVRLQQAVVDRLRSEAFAAILAARWTFLLRHRPSDVVEIVTSGAARTGSALVQLLNAAVTATVFLATAAVSLVVSPELTTLVLLGVAGVGAVLLRSVRPAGSLGREFGRRNRELQSVMMDSLDSLRLARAHDAAGVWQEQLDEAFAGTRRVQLAHVRRTSAVSAVSSVGLVAAAAVLVVLATRMRIPPATTVLVLLLSSRLTRSMQSLVGNAQLAANLLPAVRDVLSLTAGARAEAETPATTTKNLPMAAPAPGVPMVRLRRVSFRYPGSENGVRELSCDLPTGQVTALTGPSGAGKSTVADLVLGLLQPDDGWVEVAGRRLTPESVRSWRARVAYVPQETVLVPGSLRANLVWSVPRRVDDAECWRCLDAAAADFAHRLPEGLDTLVGDRGMRLSGGERQRIAIARALLRRPALLVLDEATSALDDVTESAVLDLVTSLAPAVTVLVVAHRRSTLAAAHQVVRLRQGRLDGSSAVVVDAREVVPVRTPDG